VSQTSPTGDPAQLRQRVRAGETVLGTFVLDFFSLGIGEIAAGSGAEFIVLDAEHSGRSWETLGAVTAVSRRAGVAVVVRVPARSPAAVSQAFDLGAHGVMVAMVDTAEEATAAVRAAKYPPVGTRGAAFGWAHGDRPDVDHAAALARRNEDTVVIVQIETAEGVEHVEDIAAVDGVDALWIGHLDLSASVGTAGDLTSAPYEAAVGRIARAAQAHGVALGFADLDGTGSAALVERGFTLIAVGADSVLYSRALTQAIDTAVHAITSMNGEHA
jgi:2-dehydro-3-deoxyglucarate aldolase/4-hydroxy-2-oxoheptanedioate aldolase